MFVSHVLYGLRLAANMALPGLPLWPDSDAFDVRIRLKDWGIFPTTFPESIDFFYTSPQDAAPGRAELARRNAPWWGLFRFFL